MAFWEKKEDPWDIDPAKARARRERRREREEAGSLPDRLQKWKEDREARAAEREAAWAAEPVEKCPWCGKDMERGYLISGRGIITWTPGRMTARSAWVGPPKEIRERRLQVDNEGGMISYKTTWYCPDCEKMTIDAAGLKSPMNTNLFADEVPLPEERGEEQGGEEGEEAP